VINGTRHRLPAPLPNLIVAGAQKSGTTALASILSRHPQIRSAAAYADLPDGDEDGEDEPGGHEVHFFDHHYRAVLEEAAGLSPSPRDRRCWVRYRYATYYRDRVHRRRRRRRAPGTWRRWWQQHQARSPGDALTNQQDVRYRLEKAPSYLLSPHVPGAVQHVLGPHSGDGEADGGDENGEGDEGAGAEGPFVLVLLRDPVRRLLSQHRMIARRQAARGVGPGGSGARAANGTGGGAGGATKAEREHELVRTLDRELVLLRNPLRTYLTSVFDPGGAGSAADAIPSRTRGLFDIPPAPPLGSEAYDSHYRWDDPARAPSSFREYDRLLQRGMYSVQLERWIRAMGGGAEARQDGGGKAGAEPAPRDRGRLVVIPYELFQSHPREVLDYVWRRLGVSRWRVPSDVLEKRYDPVRSRASENVGDEEDAGGSDADENGEATTEADGMSPAVLRFLSEFYRPYNGRLADLLGEEWRGIWDAEASSAAAAHGGDYDWKEIWLQKFRRYLGAEISPRGPAQRRKSQGNR
jgi:hypothetical protein